MKKYLKWILIPIVTISILAIIAIVYYNVMLSPVGGNDKISVTIPVSSTGASIGTLLEEKGLIRDKNIFKLYLKLNNVNDLKHGTYFLSKDMTVKEIVETLRGALTTNDNDIKILFKEGLNINKIAAIIESNTSNTKEDVYNTLKDTDYINSVIDKYWFISDEIKNADIYYPLEGYLFPDTYYFKNTDSVKDIFNKMLEQMNDILEPYKSKIENSNYSAHEYLTLASVIELEGLTAIDRLNIAGVFYNRLNDGMPLGSDVTTYYAAKIDTYSRDLYQTEIDSNNPYNTRNSNTAGKLPVGPIASPSKSSIEAAINPIDNNYYYFVADKNAKVYFARTYSEHLRLIDQIKEAGLWLFE